MLLGALGGPFKHAVEVGGDEADGTLTATGQLQQGGVCVSGALAAPLGLKDLRERLAHGNTLPWQPPLQQIQRGIELSARVGLLFDGRTGRAHAPINFVHQSLESRQPCGVGNACTTEKHHTTLFVRLQ